jgi:hypothetical protein
MANKHGPSDVALAKRPKQPLKRLMDKLPELTSNLEREYHARKGETRPG